MTQAEKLTVLAFEGPMLRAYEHALREAHIRPDCVITLVPRRDAITGKEVARWLPPSVRARYAARLNDMRQNYWPRRLKRTAAPLVEAMHRRLAPRFSFFESFFQGLDRAFRPAGWAHESELLLADGLGDTALAERLAGQGTVLYTGGGIIPQALLASPGTRFVHIHPGLLPHVRGADGLLWSTLLRDRPGRTAFFMTREMDHGPVLRAEEVEPVTFEALAPRPDDQTLYRAIYSYYDPCLRAELAAAIIGGDCGTPRDGARPGLPGPLFPFMSWRMRALALRRVFPAE